MAEFDEFSHSVDFIGGLTPQRFRANPEPYISDARLLVRELAPRLPISQEITYPYGYDSNSALQAHLRGVPHYGKVYQTKIGDYNVERRKINFLGIPTSNEVLIFTAPHDPDAASLIRIGYNNSGGEELTSITHRSPVERRSLGLVNNVPWRQPTILWRKV